MHTIIHILLETGGMPTLHIYKTLIQCITQTSQATCLHYAFQQNASIIYLWLLAPPFRLHQHEVIFQIGGMET